MRFTPRESSKQKTALTLRQQKGCPEEEEEDARKRRNQLWNSIAVPTFLGQAIQAIERRNATHARYSLVADRYSDSDHHSVVAVRSASLTVFVRLAPWSARRR